MTNEASTSTDVPEYLAFGDLGVDSVALIDHLPRPDEKVWVEPAGDFPGGMMGNAAVAVACLGVSAGVVALIGSDARGASVLEALRRRNVETRFVREVDAPTFWTLSLTIASGDRSLIQFPTPAFGADWEGFDMGLLSKTRWVHTVAEEGGPIGALLRDAQQAGAQTSLDIEFPFILSQDLIGVLPYVNVAFLNAAAADAVGGAEKAARFAQEHGVSTALVTLGERGAFLCEPSSRSQYLPACKVEAIDTNGAGDAFAGAFAAGVLKGLEARDAAELAVYVAGRSTTALGGFGVETSLTELRELVEASGYGWWKQL
jgi:sugar/nucleoside kinase (ribokinase family)